MRKVIFDGPESEAFNHEVVLQCRVCDVEIKMPFNKLIKKSHYVTSNKIDSNFLYEGTLECKNNHVTTVLYRFEEVQPVRYEIELLDIKSSRQNGFKKQLKHVGIILLISVIPIFIIWLNVSLILSHIQTNALQRNGVPATATVSDRYGSPGGARRVAYYELTYRYDLDGREYTDVKQVDVNTYNFSAVGDELQIYYDAQNPQITAVENNDVLFIDTVLVILVDVAVLATVYWIYKSSKKATATT